MVTSLFNQTPAARDDGYQNLTVLRKKFTFATGNTKVVVGVIPPKALVIGGGVFTTVAFNSGTNNLVDVGHDDATPDPNAFATLLSVAAIGFLPLDELGAVTNTRSALERTITVTPALSGTAATAGEAEVVVLVSCDHEGGA